MLYIKVTSMEFVTYQFSKFAEKYDMNGSLPIHKAVGGGHISIIEELLFHCPQRSYGVDRKARTHSYGVDRKARTILQFAVNVSK